jgi:alpha-1,2-mannosyltransferase
VDTAFKALLSARFCAAIWTHITDCDETFNYWEPLHYLIYGNGLQTWEYSPQFALRSYTYLLVHGVPAWCYEQIFKPNPMLVFYFVRCLLGLVCAIVEVYFYKGVCREFGVHIGRMWLIFQLFAAGMFISSTALLPSTFSMYCCVSALTAWWHQKYKLAIFFTAISALLGWPFAALVGVPIALDMLVRLRKVKTFLVWSIISAATVLIPMVLIDSSYFGKLALAPLNIVLYNVFTAHGPNLYGVEPFQFYFINGFLNFNFIWLLALITPVLIAVGSILVPAKSKSTLTLPYYLSLAPFYIWLAVFLAQPHKEERFLFPIYPMISLCGAISLDIIQKLFFRLKSWFCKLPAGTHYLNHSMFIAATFMLLTMFVGFSRIFSLYRNYHAPLDLMMELNNLPKEGEWALPPGLKQVNVCVGKDWYRYPSSFFLPSKQFRVRFLKSEFKGILPAYYSDAPNSTRLVHAYFNDLNQENEHMYADYAGCDFLLDLDLNRYTLLEPNYAARTDDWRLVKSLPFLNADESNTILRAFYVPFVSDRYVSYGAFNLLQRKRGAAASPPPPPSKPAAQK